MLLIDSRELWNKGGYGKDNDFDVSIARMKFYAETKGCKDIELILTEFFLELNEEPTRYYNEDHSCFCSCEIGNSGTNAIHTVFKRIDLAVQKEKKKETDAFTERLNKMIMVHIEKDNERYINAHGPKDSDGYKWYEMPTFKKLLRIKK